MTVTASAPGQIFFFGEHSVVYGRPALIAAVNLRTTSKATLRTDNKIVIKSTMLGTWEGKVIDRKVVGAATKEQLPAFHLIESILQKSLASWGVNLEITSEIPIRSGMSSSAAFLVSAYAALATAYGIKVERKDIFDAVIELQREIHGGLASGAGIATSTFGGYSLYQGGNATPLDLDFKPQIVVGDTSIQQSTARTLQLVADGKKQFPEIYEKVFDMIADVVNAGKDALLKKDLARMGDLMNINHGLLSALGVSSTELDNLVHAARQAGAYGAKLTGGGGGKSMIALVDKPKPIAAAIARAKGNPIITEVGAHGVTISGGK